MVVPPVSNDTCIAAYSSLFNDTVDYNYDYDYVNVSPFDGNTMICAGDK